MTTENQHRSILLTDYMNEVEPTDRLSAGDTEPILLGLFGEVGSLLSELKKRRRDKEPQQLYARNQLEEFGDALWYFSTLAARASRTLEDIARLALAMPDSSLPAYTGEPLPTRFLELQSGVQNIGPSDETMLSSLLELGFYAGQIVGDSNKIGLGTEELGVLGDSLQCFFRHFIAAANGAGLSLDTAALKNLEKTESRWPALRVHSERFDKNADPEERFPDEIRMEFRQKKLKDKKYVYQRWNEVNIGDRLTDNSTEEDDFRFHDVFHLAHYAILGWSPVLRALLRLKRKGEPKTDEVEDGARAILIEEGIATWVFTHSKELAFFRDTDRLEYGLLKSIHRLTIGLEVNTCGLWEWERAILDGYAAFRSLRENEGGIIIASLATRLIGYERLK